MEGHIRENINRISTANNNDNLLSLLVDLYIICSFFRNKDFLYIIYHSVKDNLLDSWNVHFQNKVKES